MAAVPAWGGAASVDLGIQSFSFKALPFDAMLDACELAGSKSIELFSGHIEQGWDARSTPAGRERLRDWRIAEGEAYCREIRSELKRRGFRLNAFNLTIRDGHSDEEIDATFRMTKALGTDLLTSSSNVASAPRIAPFARKYSTRVAFHNHAVIKPDEFATPEDFERAMEAEPHWFGVNLDTGHFHAAGFDCLAFLEKHGERIFALHMKDRKAHDGPKLPFGMGDTPLREIVCLVRDRNWRMPANIEMAYPTDDPVREVRESLGFLRAALAG
ncbi:MAG: sugar phosphate isomerase/epimerase [Bryobacterales bacterium]|nr:sugar phosphate isomerase/epimerase [Bryobacterales bacterium]